MLGKSTRAFDSTAHAPGDIARLWKSDPVAAARWTVGVAKAAGATSQAIDQLEAVLTGQGTDADKAGALTQFIAATPALLDLSDAKAMAAAQANGVASLTWEAAPSPQAAYVTGRPVLVDGVVKFETTHGTFDLDMPATWREEIETAFLGAVVTVKGTPSPDGQRIAVEHWGPGTEPSFTGRVQLENGEVYLAPSGTLDDDAVRVTNRELKRLLMNQAGTSWNAVGVLLPGEPKLNEVTKKLEYDRFPEQGFYILTRLMKLDVQPLPDGRTVHLAETAYFKHSAAIAAKDVPIPEGSKPGAWPFPEGDATTGSTRMGENGPRVFAFAKPVPSDAKIAGLDLRSNSTFQRALEISWVSLPADVGTRSPAGAPVAEAVELPERVANMARTLPAAQPEMEPHEALFAPAGRK